jgi:PKD repeat protein
MPAADIAFRNLTVYLTSSSQYADARTYAIQSAQDLFGACTPEVEATTNAWYACGVGGPYNPTVTAAFAANLTSSCSVPATVTFTNNSTNTNTAVWDFGDNSTSTNYNPTHVYNTPGTYNVQLIGSSACGIDTVLQSSFITINTPPAATGTGASSCTPASMTLSATGS